MIDCHHDGQLKVIGLQPKFLSKKFLKFTGTDAMTQNNMIVFGTKIPDILLRNPLSWYGYVRSAFTTPSSLIFELNYRIILHQRLVHATWIVLEHPQCEVLEQFIDVGSIASRNGHAGYAKHVSKVIYGWLGDCAILLKICLVGYEDHGISLETIVVEWLFEVVSCTLNTLILRYVEDTYTAMRSFKMSSC